MKVLFCSSPGGHWVQLQRISELLRCSESFFIKAKPVGQAESGKEIEDFSIREIWRGIKQLLLARRIIKEYSPDIVISTGAAPGLLILLAARLAGCQCIWIDSIANSRKLSLSGRAACFFCQHVLTQWPELARGRIRYLGRLI